MRNKILKKTGLGLLALAVLAILGWQCFQKPGMAQEEKNQNEYAESAETDNAKEEETEQAKSREITSDKEDKEQKEPKKNQEETIEGFSHIEPEPVLDFAGIQLMEAGTVLDVSHMETDMVHSLFYSEELGEELQQRISGISYQENDNISFSELRYLRVLHMGFDGQTHIGELVVNASIAEELLEIMEELYKNSYPIEKMILIDAYNADDELSMSDNNTSAFNYREIAGTSRMSRHSLGVAIDINPRYNPYVKKSSSGETTISPANGADYADRNREFEHKIDENDLCYKLFTEHGFTWGGSWNSVKDYQHFEK